MDITTNIDKKIGLRMHRVTGAVTKDELLKKLEEIYSHPDFFPDMNVLWDFRGASLSSFTSSDVQRVRDFVSGRWGTGGESRAALVVSRDVDFGLSRMYGTLSETETKSPIRVFKDFDEAMKWTRSQEMSV